MTSQFESYVGKPTSDVLRESAPPEVKADHSKYLEKAKVLVANDFNTTFFPDDKSSVKTTDKDFYVVWFVKVLGNWKALVSTDVISGQYWEVTYNGGKRETYVDHYVKRHNQGISDSSYEGLVAHNARVS